MSRYAHISGDGTRVLNIIEAEESFVLKSELFLELLADKFVPCGPGWTRTNPGEYTAPDEE